MDERRWLKCADPARMFFFLAGRARAGTRSRWLRRGMRRFACACVRAVWHLLDDERSRRAVELSERFADGEVGRKALQAARLPAWQVLLRFRTPDTHHPAAELAAQAAAYAVEGDSYFMEAATMATDAAAGGKADRAAKRQARQRQAAILRDLFSPFHPVALDPGWLGANGRLGRLAEAIHREQAFDRLPDLADALAKAGCVDADLLGHLRGPGPHVRGCWAVELLRGKSARAEGAR